MRQNLRLEAMYNWLRNATGDHTTPALARLFLQMGWIDVLSPEEQAELLVGRIVRGYRERCVKNREIQHELINLVRLVEDPVTHKTRDEHYWRQFGELDEGEHVQHMCKWEDRTEECYHKFYYYYDELSDEVQRKVQRTFEFDGRRIPPRPRRPEPPHVDDED